MATLTLVEARKVMVNQGQTERAGIIQQFAERSDLLRAIPFMDIAGNSYAYSREGALSTAAFRGVNESYTPSTGVVDPAVEALRIVGGDLDVDNFILDTGGEGAREVQEEMKAKAMSAEVTRVIIKGDSSSQPREFDGLQVRLTGDQLIENGSTDGGDALSLLKFDEAIDAVPDPTHIVMNKTMKRRLTVAARTTSVGGQIDYSVDEFGQQVTRYNGIPLLLPYGKSQGTDPIAFDEVGSGGSTATATSIYIVALAPGRLAGIQNGIMDVRQLGELDAGPRARTRVEWYISIVLEDSQGAARLRGISNAIVVA